MDKNYDAIAFISKILFKEDLDKPILLFKADIIKI